MTGSIIINPEPTTARCSPRNCTSIGYSPCLNNGMCTDIPGAGFNCSCSSNFFGEGCQFFNACSNNPCLNGGQCSPDPSNANQFSCMCGGTGFNGVTCENRISPCISSSCSSAATCVASADGTTFECMCPQGFTGSQCETNINDCSNNPCENGGTCTDGIGTFSCSCPPEFSGPSCSIQVIFCSPDACQNGGTCNEVENGFTCSCPSGVTGNQCAERISQCQREPCQNGATCVDVSDTFMCLCAQGFTGTTCDVTIDFCSNDSCSNNGICTSLTTGFECACETGYTGMRCEIDINECESSPCSNNATCFQGIGFFICVCESGFTGTSCDIDINECSSLPCENGGTCVDELGQFVCQCPTGFSGATCGVQVDFCIGQICHNGGNCSSTADGFVCMCPTGWTGDRCQYALNVVAKLDSCGFTMARDMLADTGLVDGSGPLSIINGSPPVSFQYNLANAMGIYFSGWIWQQSGTNAVLFSFTDSLGSAGRMISDLTNRELRFYYSTFTAEVINVTFAGVPLVGSSWMHIALAVFNDNSIIVNINGYSRNGTLMDMNTGSNSEAPVRVNFQVPSDALVNIARGESESQLSSLDSAQSFSGLVRGIAINRIINDSSTFSLNSLQACTLTCIGGETFCSANAQCRDLFGPDRRCSCSYGWTGLLCQQVHDRFSFDGSSFAMYAGQSTSQSVQVSFKTEQSSGEIYSHTTSSVQTQVLLRDNRTVNINQSYCDQTSEERDLSAPLELNDLQYHTVVVSNMTQLDSNNPQAFPLTFPPCSITLTPNFILGSFGISGNDSNFQGCMRDVLIGGTRLDSTLLRFTGRSGFGCTRDTAQFNVFSHLELPQFISRESQIVSLEFSTHANSGILYFSRRVPGDATGNTSSDFLAIHINAGQALFTLNLGEQNVVLRSNVLVNDGQWHSITAVQNGTLASLYIDNVLRQTQSMGPLMLLDTTSNIFIGGVPSGNRIAGFTNYAGFDGCVRDLEQNRVAADLQGYISVANVRFGVCN